MTTSQPSPEWLANYYGEEFYKLNPIVVLDGKAFAVVRIVLKSGPSSSSLGFVLIKKNGKHGVSEWKSLFEGVPNQAALDKMKAVLAEEDK